MTESKPKAEVFCIFPTTILLMKYPGDFKKEFKYIRELEFDDQQITGVFRSKDTYLLKHPEFDQLKSFFYTALNTYCEKIFCTKNRVDITQAWVQRNGRGSFTHDHTHPNSILSGVFYFRNDDQAPITFSKDIINRLALPQEKSTTLNSEAFVLHPKSGDLLIFPSNLRHSVSINPKEESRYCMSFNSFCYQTLGQKESLTHLTIKEG